MISLQEIYINNKQIEVIRDWLKSQLIQDIQVFLGFANFYCYFIQDFNQIATPLISMLRTIRIDLSTTNPVLIDKGSIMNRVGNSEVNGAKVDTKTAKYKNKAKSKNMIKSFWLNSNLLHKALD